MSYFSASNRGTSSSSGVHRWACGDRTHRRQHAVKRITRTDGPFDLLRRLDARARATKATLRDEVSHEAVLADLAKQLEGIRTNETLAHGLRVEAMFGHVAASLGQCRLIKQEDAGEIYTLESRLRAPDYRLVLIDGSEFFVEVKNHRPKDGFGEDSLTPEYLASVQAYAKAFGKELYFAIYWSQTKLWALVPDSAFILTGDRFVLSLPEAMKRNQMVRLGDVMIATLPSLTLKFYSDPAKPRRVGAEGETPFTIARAEFLCGDKVLEAGKETEIAWFLLNYGRWPAEQLPAEIESGELISFGFHAAPEERTPGNDPFEIIGFLSQMISIQYNVATAADGKVDLLAPNYGPDELGIVIPKDFRSERLPLWMFQINPAK